MYFRTGSSSALKTASAIDNATNRLESVTATGNASNVLNVGFRTHSFLIQNNGKKNTDGSLAQTARESKVFVLEVQSNCAFESKLDSIVRFISTKRNTGNSYPPLGTFKCCGFKVEILPRSSRPVHIPYSPGRQMKVQSLYAIRIRVTSLESTSSNRDKAMTNCVDSSSLTLPKLSGPFLASSSSHASAAGISAFNQLKMSRPSDSSSQSVRNHLSDPGHLATQCKIGPFTDLQTAAAGPSSLPSGSRPKPSILCSSKFSGILPVSSQGSTSARVPLQASTATFQQPTASAASSLALSRSSTSAECSPSSPSPKLTIAACFSLSSNSAVASSVECGALDVNAVDLTGDCLKADEPKTNLTPEASDEHASTGGVERETALSENVETPRRMEVVQEPVKTGSVSAPGCSVRLLVPHSGPRPASIRTSLSAMPKIPPGVSTMFVKLGNGKIHRVNVKDWNDLMQKQKLRGQQVVSATQTKNDESYVKTTDVNRTDNDAEQISLESTVAGSLVESNDGLQHFADNMPSTSVSTSLTSDANAKALATDRQINRNISVASQQSLCDDMALSCVSSSEKSSDLQDAVRISSSDVDVVSIFYNVAFVR